MVPEKLFAAVLAKQLSFWECFGVIIWLLTFSFSFIYKLTKKT